MNIAFAQIWNQIKNMQILACSYMQLKLDSEVINLF